MLNKHTIGALSYIECLIEEGWAGTERQRQKIRSERAREMFNSKDLTVQIGKETRRELPIRMTKTME